MHVLTEDFGGVLIGLLGFVLLILFIWSKVPKGTSREIHQQDITASGVDGEKHINRILNEIPEGRLVPNFMFQVNGVSHQIDHILVHPNGIFVIETKNFKGRIYGNKDQQNWTQVLAYGQTKHQLYNPIKQNQGHIRALAKILNPVGHYSLKGFVVFLVGAELYIEADPGDVIYPTKIKETITTPTDTQLSAMDIEKVYNYLMILKNRCQITDQDHVTSINNRLNGTTCPYCGKPLVVKHGKYGDFTACSRYPNCNYIRKRSKLS